SVASSYFPLVDNTRPARESTSPAKPTATAEHSVSESPLALANRWKISTICGSTVSRLFARSVLMVSCARMVWFSTKPQVAWVPPRSIASAFIGDVLRGIIQRKLEASEGWQISSRSPFQTPTYREQSSQLDSKGEACLSQ